MKSLSVSKLFNLTGKTALVTGGGRGIGKMIAQGFVENGVKVYICSRSRDACEATARELTNIGPGKCYAIAEDLATEAGCKRLAEEFMKKESKLHILVNNSGTSWGEPLEKFSEKGFDKVMALNVKAPFFLTRNLLPALDAGANAGDPARVFPTYSYDASKSAIHQLTLKLAYDLARRGDSKSITVNAIAPGYVPSSMSNQLLTYVGKEAIESGIPLGRMGAPSDMAGAALFLSSPASAWITGLIMNVDGGALTYPVAMGPESKL